MDCSGIVLSEFGVIPRCEYDHIFAYMLKDDRSEIFADFFCEDSLLGV